MKNIIVLCLTLLFAQCVFAQNIGPISDSLKKYQELIEHAKTQEEKIRLALQLQKIIYGKSSIDTALIKRMPSSKEDALKQKDAQLAEINRQKKNIDTSKSRKDKYTAIQKLQAKNDSIIAANKNAGQHSGIQPGLITLPNADQMLADPRAPIDTSEVQISFTYRKNSTNKNGSSSQSFSISSTTATMYRQNGAIIIVATNDALPQYLYQNNVRKVVMVNRHDLSGTANSQGGGPPGVSNQKFSFGFAYNPASNQFAIGAGAGLIVRYRDAQDKMVEDTGGIGASAHNDPSTWKIAGTNNAIKTDEPVAHFTKTQTGFSASYNNNQGDKDAVTSESFSAEIILSPPRYEAFIEPADTAIYRKWIPQGPVLTNYPALPNKGKGNDIQLKVTLWDKLTNKPASDIYKAVIKLNNVSNMPGYCMNFPENNKDADDKPDMRFDRDDSSIYEKWSEDKISTRSSSEPQFVTVVSYDYGGIADVTADVTTPEGFTLKAHLRTSTADTFTLPKRTNGSYIADYWKLQQNAMEKADTADDEEIEVNDDRYPGDGLTLYEEYRGFLENRKHFRGNAEKKDMMVCNKIATPRSQDGIDNCEAVLNQYGNRVVMHSRFKDDEFGRKHDPEADELKKMADRSVTTVMKYDRCLNYNNIENLHLVDQHGVVLMNSNEKLGYAEAVRKDTLIGPPKNMYFLVITKDFNPGPDGWAETYGSLDDDGNIGTGEGGAKVLTDEYARTIAHEMLHCFHILHHGDDGDYGKLEFVYSGLGNSWEIIKKNKEPYLDANGWFYKVKLFWEDDPTHEINPEDTSVAPHRWRIYGDNSTHAGVEDCIMRYDVAKGYIRGSDIYLIRGKTIYRELSGINLCNSTIGTGVNAKTHKPMSRYGDAAPGRGDCIHQFCVSDRYD